MQVLTQRNGCVCNNTSPIAIKRCGSTTDVTQMSGEPCSVIAHHAYTPNHAHVCTQYNTELYVYAHIPLCPYSPVQQLLSPAPLPLLLFPLTRWGWRGSVYMIKQMHVIMHCTAAQYHKYTNTVVVRLCVGHRPQLLITKISSFRMSLLWPLERPFMSPSFTAAISWCRRGSFQKKEHMRRMYTYSSKMDAATDQ